MERKEYKRRISLEKDFMNYSIDDRLFGVLYYLATFHIEQDIYYLTKKKFQQKKAEIKMVCTAEGDAISTQQLNRLIKKLKDNNLIVEQQIKTNNKMVDAYVFPKPPETSLRYQLIDNEMLWYVVSTRNKQAVKIYTYLVNKFLWKQQTQELYTFTKKELLTALGYSSKSDNKLALSMVGNILESFQREGIVEIAEFFEEITLDNSQTVPSHKYRLVNILLKKSDLKTVN